MALSRTEQELIITKRYNKLVRKLKGMGLVNLGGGFFSTVFGAPGGDYVWKISKPRNLNEIDGWLKYAEWVKADFISDLTPRIGKIRRYYCGEYMFYVAKIERLEPLDDDENSAAQEIREKISNYLIMGNYNEIARLDTKHIRMAMMLRRNFEAKYRFDLHKHNIMHRPGSGEADFVITDPVSFNASGW